MNALNSLLPYLPISLKNKHVLQLDYDNETTQVLNDQSVLSATVLNTPLGSSASSSIISYSDHNLSNYNITTNKFDLIYSNLQLVQLKQNELILNSIEKSLRLLNLNGFLLIRDVFDEEQATLSPIDFISLIQSKEINDDVNDNHILYGFDLVFAKPDLENHNGFKTLKEFMDNKQYTRNGVLRYEKIFGEGFVSTGGIDTTVPFLEELQLQPGQKVLDVGCGIGGGDFLMASKYGVEVTGVDLASNMIGICWDRAVAYPNLRVKFEIGDILKNKFPHEHFDVIYSRDTILHIEDKETLFSLFKDWLKPGGKIFITDYCCGPKPWSNEYAEYVAQRGYNLLTVQEYGHIFEKLNYSKVVATDTTDLFVQCLNNELDKFAQMKQQFVDEFSDDDFNYLIEGWNAKLVRCAQGHQRWGKFYCEK